MTSSTLTSNEFNKNEPISTKLQSYQSILFINKGRTIKKTLYFISILYQSYEP